MWVVIGSRTPAMSDSSVDQPAVQLSTWPAAIVPRLVSTWVIRLPVRLSASTSVFWWISAPPASAERARPQTTASWRMMPPGG